MGQLAFLKMFILVAISLDVNDNRRHVHVFRRENGTSNRWLNLDRVRWKAMCGDSRVYTFNERERDACCGHQPSLGLHQRTDNKDIQR